MKITLLGTASAFPTKERAHSATLLDTGPESLLFDCGENAQRQIRLAGANLMKISKIFLSHWHGDHVLGLGGLLQSFQMNNRAKPVDIYGPEGTRQRFRHLLGAFELRVKYPINVYEVKAKQRPFKILDAEKYEVWAISCKHPVSCLAFAYKEKDKRRVNVSYIKKFGLKSHPIIKKLQQGKSIVWKGRKISAAKATYIQKGKKFVYIIDSAYSESLVRFSKEADLLICEATFASGLKDIAREFGHLSAGEAATIAKKAKVKKLVITHFSQRYKDVSVLLKEAKKIFSKTESGKDLMEFEL